MSGDLERLIFSCVDRYMNGGTGHVGGNHFHERHGMVTSYDPDKYIAKVMYQPEGQESGWLGIETGHVGESYGIAIGLEPGDGKKTGDQVIVRFQEGDLESGKIVQRIHSDNEKPPRVEAGELVMWAKFKKSKGSSGLGDDATETGGSDESDAPDGAQGGSGQQVYFKKDGSHIITDGNGAMILLDGNGNITLTCKKFTVNASSDIKLISSTNALLKGAAAILYATGNAFVKAISAVNVKGASNLADPTWTNGASDPPISS